MAIGPSTTAVKSSTRTPANGPLGDTGSARIHESWLATPRRAPLFCSAARGGTLAQTFVARQTNPIENDRPLPGRTQRTLRDAGLAHQPRPVAARMRGAARRGARLPGRRDGRRAGGQTRAQLGGLEPRVHAQHGRARLDRHDLAQALRRRRTLVARALCRARGDARRRRPGGRALGRRPPERAAADALFARRAGAAVRAAHRARRSVLLHRHERARLRLRPRVDPHQGRPHRAGLADQRPQGVDLARPPAPTT